MAQNKKLNNEITRLSDLKTPENWMEITGPFYSIKTESNQLIGPFHSHDISSLLEFTTLPDGTLIKDAKNTTEWTPLYSHPTFQRRKPSLITEISNIQASSFYYLKNGSPVGPIKPSDMEMLIHAKDIISTDAVSIDEGKTWLKLYQVPGFDQRSYTASELPIIPEKRLDELGNTNSYIKNDQSSQIANLVYLESRKSKEQETVRSDVSEDTSRKSNSGLYIILALLTLGIMVLLSQDDTKTIRNNSKQSTLKASTKVSQDEVKRTPAKSKATPRSPRNRTRTAPTREVKPKDRTPKSFTSTPIYQDRKKIKDNALLEDEPYYEDGEGDIENDAVRKAVSKETLYPEDSEVLEPEQLEEDIYIDEFDDLNSAENEISTAEDVWGDEIPRKNDSSDPFEDEEY